SGMLPCVTTGRLRGVAGAESGVPGQVLWSRRGMAAGENVHQSLWHRPYQIIRRGCRVHVVPSTRRKITRSFLISGRLMWYGRGDGNTGDAGGEVRVDLPA